MQSFIILFPGEVWGYQLKPGQPTVQGFQPTAVEANPWGEFVPRYVGSPGGSLGLIATNTIAQGDKQGTTLYSQ